METSTNPGPSTPPPAGPPPGSHNANTGMAVLSYLSILVVIPLISDAKNDLFVKFHVKQGLVLLISEVIGWVFLAVPFVGWFLAPVLQLIFLILIIIGIMNAVNGQTKELPIIGHLARSINI
jgi:uncharacterized membrane protein